MVQVIERTAQVVMSTRAGETLARALGRVLHEIEMARSEALLASARESLEVTVGALPMAGSRDLALATHAFMKAFPKGPRAAVFRGIEQVSGGAVEQST